MLLMIFFLRVLSDIMINFLESFSLKNLECLVRMSCGRFFVEDDEQCCMV